MMKNRKMWLLFPLHQRGIEFLEIHKTGWLENTRSNVSIKPETDKAFFLRHATLRIYSKTLQKSSDYIWHHPLPQTIVIVDGLLIQKQEPAPYMPTKNNSYVYIHTHWHGNQFHPRNLSEFKMSFHFNNQFEFILTQKRGEKYNFSTS